MIYELSCDGCTLGVFPSESEALYHAAYLPKGRYTVREWNCADDNMLVFDPEINSEREIINN